MKKILLIVIFLNLVSCVNTTSQVDRRSDTFFNEDAKIVESDIVKGKDIEDVASSKNAPKLYEDEIVVDEEVIEEEKRQKFISKYNKDYENERQVEILRQKAIDARVDKRGIIINLEDALFAFNSATLTLNARKVMKEISDYFQTIPNDLISVEGHTDSVGTVIYNQRLSEQRARNVVEELVKNGVSRSRLKAKGFGESDPIATNRTEGGRARNRRVELVF